MYYNAKFVFRGPYVFDYFEENDHMLEQVPNQYYPDADTRHLIELKKFANGDSLAKAVEKKHVDIGFHLLIHALPVEGVEMWATTTWPFTIWTAPPCLT